MKIRIPFVFEAAIVRKGCQAPRSEFIADTAEVEILEPSNLRLAATVDKTDYFYDGDHFYRASGPTENEAGKQVPMSVDAWAERALDLQGVFAQSPSIREAVFGYADLWTPQGIAEQSPFADYLGDFREQALDALQSLVSTFIVSNGGIMQRTPEPVYVVAKYGLPDNNAGTQLRVEESSAASLLWDRDMIIPLNQPDQAIKKAEREALGRGDTESVPVKPTSEVCLHLPEVFTFDPFSREAFNANDISLSDYLKHNGQQTDQSADLIETGAKVLMNKVKRMSIADQVAWLQEQGFDEGAIMAAYGAG